MATSEFAPYQSRRIAEIGDYEIFECNRGSSHNRYWTVQHKITRSHAHFCSESSARLAFRLALGIIQVPKSIDPWMLQSVNYLKREVKHDNLRKGNKLSRRSKKGKEQNRPCDL